MRAQRAVRGAEDLVTTPSVSRCTSRKRTCCPDGGSGLQPRAPRGHGYGAAAAFCAILASIAVMAPLVAADDPSSP
jgi:hypothetical protein